MTVAVVENGASCERLEGVIFEDREPTLWAAAHVIGERDAGTVLVLENLVK